MKVTLAEMELQALWYLDSLERIYGDEFQGQSSPKIWINVAIHVANMLDGVGAERQVPAGLVHGLASRGLVERTVVDLFRISAAGKEILIRSVPEGARRAPAARTS